MAVGISAGELRRNFCTPQRRCVNIEIMRNNSEIKPRIVKYFDNRAISEQCLKVRRIIIFAVKLNQMRSAISSGELQQTKTVAGRLQPHGFRIHRD